MPSEQPSSVERLFDELADLDAAARAARLGALARERPHVANDVASLLAAADRAGDFLGLLGGAPAGAPEPIAGRYRAERLLGAGAMGEVYLARDEELERPVALKFLRASACADPGAVARFVAEARAAARLDHPHVATVYDIGRAGGGRLFIAMAYYPGETLRDRLARGPLPPADALRIAEQLAGALAAAHAAGIVHRDVKPANVLFDADGLVKLADFGVAKLPGHEATAGGGVVGTAAYMAPEQARGEAVDARADLWALGVVLYEMLAGRRPFVGDAAALLHQILHAPPPPLAFPDAALPEGTERVLAALLAKEPARRYASAAAAADALRALRAGVAPAAPPAAPRAAPNALPHPLTSFVGRERELDAALSLLARARLVTLTGPGGTGKTRLALRAAEAARDAFPDGVWWVPLADVRSADAVPAAVAHALGVREGGASSLVERVRASLRERRALLVLDNFEHVADAAPFVAGLLGAAPHAAALVTSRAPLRVQGEHELAVPPLALPAGPAARPEDAEAVRLFMERARAVRPDFAPDGEDAAAVVEICRRLDGLPLAIELAAARARLLSPRAILARLGDRLDFLRSDARDRPARHRTLREVIDWSHALLGLEERALYRRLAVFAGGLTVDAARAVARDAACDDALDALASLCEKNLLRQAEDPDGEPRFHMLETVREHALERLREAGEEAAARRAHRRHFLALAERAEPELRGRGQAAWLDRLERERHNLAAALDDALADDAPDALGDAARLAAALHRFWLTRGHVAEGARRLGAVIARLDAVDDASTVGHVVRGRVLAGAGLLASDGGSFPQARALCERALAEFRAADDPRGIAATLTHLGWVAWIVGDGPAARALSEEALARHEALGDALGAAIAMNNLAWIAMYRGEHAEARERLSAALALHRERGDDRSVAYVLSNLGLLASRQGDAEGAVALLEEALARIEPVADPIFRAEWTSRLAYARHLRGDAADQGAVMRTACVPTLRELGVGSLLADALFRLAAVLRDAGELAEARAAAEEAVRVRREIGDRAAAPEPLAVLADVVRRQGDLPLAAALARASLADARALRSAPDMITAIETLALVSADATRDADAAHLLAATDRARAALGVAIPPRYRGARAALLAALAERLGPDAFARTWESGTRATLDEAAAGADAVGAV